MKKIKYIFSLFIFIILIQSCIKDEESTAPVIDLVSIYPTIVKQYTDSIDIIISYKDNQGDIGIPDADKNSLWVHDARLENPDEYFISPLAPLDSTVSIEGEFKIKLKNTFKLGTAPEEKTTYSIWIIDRNGEKSNVITTPEVIITD